MYVHLRKCCLLELSTDARVQFTQWEILILHFLYVWGEIRRLIYSLRFFSFSLVAQRWLFFLNVVHGQREMSLCVSFSNCWYSQSDIGEILKTLIVFKVRPHGRFFGRTTSKTWERKRGGFSRWENVHTTLIQVCVSVSTSLMNWDAKKVTPNFSTAIQIVCHPLSRLCVWTGNQGFWTNQKSNTSTGMETIHCSDSFLAWPWAGNMFLYDCCFFFKHAAFVNQQVCPTKRLVKLLAFSLPLWLDKVQYSSQTAVPFFRMYKCPL